MKKLLCLLLLASAAPLARAQTTVALPAAGRAADERNHDTVVVTLPDTPENIWRQLALVLLRRGYVIEHSDKDLLLLTTYPLRTGLKVNRICGVVSGHELSLRMYQILVPEADISPRNQVSRGSGNRASWQELEAIGRQMGGSMRYATSSALQ